MSGFSIHRKVIERVTLTGRGDEARKAMFDYCQRNGLHITQSGCHVINALHVDADRPKIIAEREMELLIEPLIVDQRRTTEYGTVGCEE